MSKLGCEKVKITCDPKENFFECTSEAVAVSKHKKSILKKKKKNLFNAMEESLLIFALALFVVFLLILFLKNNAYFYASIVFLIGLCYLTGRIVSITNLYYVKKVSGKKTIILNEEGLTDQSYYDIQMNFSWNKIKAVVVHKYSVTILTDTPCYFYFPISQKKKIISTIKKYHKNTLILDDTEKGKK